MAVLLLRWGFPVRSNRTCFSTSLKVIFLTVRHALAVSVMVNMSIVQGFDLTLSAPKSVSLAALVVGDQRIIETHDHAVRATLDFVEQNLLESSMDIS